MATMVAQENDHPRDRLRKCRQKIDRALESWDNVTFEEQENLVDDIKDEVEDLQFLLSKRVNPHYRMAFFEPFFMVGIVASLGVFRILQSYGWIHSKVDL